MESTTVIKDFQKEIEEMNKDAARLKIIKELEKYRERKDQRMLSDNQVHGI